MQHMQVARNAAPSCLIATSQEDQSPRGCDALEELTADPSAPRLQRIQPLGQAHASPRSIRRSLDPANPESDTARGNQLVRRKCCLLDGHPVPWLDAAQQAPLRLRPRLAIVQDKHPYAVASLAEPGDGRFDTVRLIGRGQLHATRSRVFPAQPKIRLPQCIDGGLIHCQGKRPVVARKPLFRTRDRSAFMAEIRRRRGGRSCNQRGRCPQRNRVKRSNQHHGLQRAKGGNKGAGMIRPLDTSGATAAPPVTRRGNLLDLKHWETYYRGGALATCPSGPAGGYEGETRAAWVRFFEPLPDKANILDIGTGNGAVAVIARDVGTRRAAQWTIEAVDRAQIDPPRHVPNGAQRLEGIRFHAGVAAEHLPFSDGRFDAITGHYALEYMDTAAVLREMHRVLADKARAQFILHHADSLLARSARTSLREGELVLRDTKIHRKLRKLVSMEQVAPGATDRATTELRIAIRTLKQAWAQARQNGGGRTLAVTLDAVQKLLSARTTMRADVVALEVDRAEGELRDSLRRLSDLVDHALDEAKIERLERQAADAGFEIIGRAPQYHTGTDLVGWRLVLQRT